MSLRVRAYRVTSSLFISRPLAKTRERSANERLSLTIISATNYFRRRAARRRPCLTHSTGRRQRVRKSRYLPTRTSARSIDGACISRAAGWSRIYTWRWRARSYYHAAEKKKQRKRAAASGAASGRFMEARRRRGPRVPGLPSRQDRFESSSCAHSCWHN